MMPWFQLRSENNEPNLHWNCLHCPGLRKKEQKFFDKVYNYRGKDQGFKEKAYKNRCPQSPVSPMPLIMLGLGEGIELVPGPYLGHQLNLKMTWQTYASVISVCYNLLKCFNISTINGKHQHVCQH